jgi:hypothetical protein
MVMVIVALGHCRLALLVRGIGLRLMTRAAGHFGQPSMVSSIRKIAATEQGLPMVPTVNSSSFDFMRIT